MNKLNEAATLAAIDVEGGATLLLILVPILITVAWAIIRATQRLSREAEAVVRSADESRVVAFIENNGQAIIKRLGNESAANPGLPSPEGPPRALGMFEEAEVVESGAPPEDSSEPDEPIEVITLFDGHDPILDPQQS